MVMPMKWSPVQNPKIPNNRVNEETAMDVSILFIYILC